MDTCDRIEELQRLVLSLADKLATVAEHLSRLAERPDRRKIPLHPPGEGG